MMYLRRIFPVTLFLLLAMVVAACGSSTSTGSTGSSSTPAPTAAATTATSSSTALVTTATASVKGQSQTILTDAQGKTLYYFTPDTATTTACTSTCAQTWPPLVATGSATPTSATSLPGKLTTQTTSNGSQVEYNGHMLYTFSGDTASGQTNGQGLFGKWFVVTPDLAAGSSSSNSLVLVKTATASVKGQSQTILTNTQGKTLYYFTADTATTTACTSSCLQTWPPLVATGSTAPTSATKLPGKLTTQTTANGSQVEYNGHMLYIFSGDTAPGQTNGQGLFGKWFVATPGLK